MFETANWELASHVVTVIGLPLAIGIFFYEQRKERANEEAEAYQLLSNAYINFLTVVVQNPDLHLYTNAPTPNLTIEQKERMLVLFDMLMSLFERAYLTAWAPRMTAEQQRRWNSWEDFMREWIRRDDFFFASSELLAGEDPQFADYFRDLVAQERKARIAL